MVLACAIALTRAEPGRIGLPWPRAEKVAGSCSTLPGHATLCRGKFVGPVKPVGPVDSQ